MQFVIEDITEIIEDFINDHELEKGLKRGEVIRLKSAIDLLESYESMLPDDVLAAIRDILKFAMSLTDGEKKEDEDESAEEDKKVKKKVSHDWGFSLAPSFEKEDESRSRRRKIRKKKGGKKHEWGFSFADLDIKKEDEDLDQEDEEDED